MYTTQWNGVPLSDMVVVAISLGHETWRLAGENIFRRCEVASFGFSGESVFRIFECDAGAAVSLSRGVGERWGRMRFFKTWRPFSALFGDRTGTNEFTISHQQWVVLVKIMVQSGFADPREGDKINERELAAFFRQVFWLVEHWEVVTLTGGKAAREDQDGRICEIDPQSLTFESLRDELIGGSEGENPDVRISLVLCNEGTFRLGAVLQALGKESLEEALPDLLARCGRAVMAPDGWRFGFAMPDGSFEAVFDREDDEEEEEG